MKKKIIALAMAGSLFVMNSLPTFAATLPDEVQPFSEGTTETINISLNENGLFSETNTRTSFESSILTVSTAGTDGIYESETGRFFSKLSTGEYLEVGKINVDITDIANIQEIVKTYNLSSETANHLKDLHMKNSSGEGCVLGVSVFTANALPGRSTRYYTGYAGRRYREELTKSYYQSGPAQVFVGQPTEGNTHLKKKIADVFYYIIGTAADSKTYGAYSLLDLGFSLVEPSSVPAGGVVKHSATLYSECNEKITMVVDGSTEFLGSVTHKGSFYFEDTFHPGYDIPNKTRKAPTRSFETDNYSKADEVAYKNYRYSSWHETPKEVKHFGVMFNIM